MTGYVVRPATKSEFATAVDWAADEGWNPGLDDLDAFYEADPEGFLMGFVDDQPVSAITVVRYGASYGFLGFYIVTPDHRGHGLGLQIWNAGLAHLKGRTIGLDGVVAQQENYRKSGFVLAGRNIRFTSKRPDAAVSSHGPQPAITPVTAANLAEVVAYDAPFFPDQRQGFISRWVHPGAPTKRRSLAALEDGTVKGYGVIRACRDGYKIGPLFAESRDIAERLFNALIAPIEADKAVSIDVPEDNRVAVALAEAAGFAPTFETARMYRGNAPSLPLDRTFGITTFELG